MLTPSFEARQVADCISLTIRVPHVKISEAEIDIDGKDFKFHCHPYFLWLQFSGELIEDGGEKGQYDVNTGNIIVTIPKKVKGETFHNLDMLTTLLGGKKEIDLRSFPHKPLIEVIDKNETSDSESPDSAVSQPVAAGVDESLFTIDREKCDLKTSDDPNNTADQGKDESGPTGLLTGHASRYGFADQHSGVFTKLQDEIPSIIDCPDPDNMSSQERRVARIAQEQLKFDPSYYLADLMENDCITGVMDYAPFYCCDDIPGILFNEEEKAILKELPKKEYILDSEQERCLWLGLVDIIFAFAYDNRITEGENNVESAWCICKLSSTLSWFEKFNDDVNEVVYCSMRRSLCYPLYRNYELSLLVLSDIKRIFRHGKSCLLKCLLSVRSLLNSSEPYYILNNLYVTDYCGWIQSTSHNSITSLSAELEKVSVDKASLGFELCETEKAAYLVIQEERDGEGSDGEEEEEATESSSEEETESSSEEETDNSRNSLEEKTSGAHTNNEPVDTITLGLEELCIRNEERECGPLVENDTDKRPLIEEIPV